MLVTSFPAEACTQGRHHREEERDVADGDDDEGEDVGVVVAIRRLRGVVVRRRCAVHVVAAGDQPASAGITILINVCNPMDLTPGANVMNDI